MGELSIATNTPIWVGVKLKRMVILSTSRKGNGIAMPNAIKMVFMLNKKYLNFNFYETISV